MLILVKREYFSNNERSMKKIWLLITSLFLIGILPAAIYFVGQNQEIRNKAAPATTLSIIPAISSKKTNDVFSLEITIDTGENQVVASELHISFDPTKLEAQTITNGPLFPNILASGTIESGLASITVGAADAKQPVKGTSTVAIVKFKAIAKTESPTAIKLAPNTFVGGLGEGAVNVLVGTTPATVTITETEVQATPPPTPTPTVSVQTSPTATLSANLTIISPTTDSTATQEQPTIKGKAAPGSSVTITVYSTPHTATVTADANGNWSYTPNTALEAGPHNIVASVTDQNGNTQTATSAFVVASSTESAIPVSGTVEITYLLLFIGVGLLVFGGLVLL